MRVPDLDWPADLFDDAPLEQPSPTTLEIGQPARTSLWESLQDAWFRTRLPNDCRRVPELLAS